MSLPPWSMVPYWNLYEADAVLLREDQEVAALELGDAVWVGEFLSVELDAADFDVVLLNLTEGDLAFAVCGDERLELLGEVIAITVIDTEGEGDLYRAGGVVALSLLL